MKKTLFATLLLATTLAAAAQTTPLWMRFPAISPDGKQIVFSYKGDLFTVSSQGGEAHQLTTNAAYDTRPLWSPDGQRIAFASDREGSFDVYVINATGGTPTRLTTSSRPEMPVVFSDNSHVLFSHYGMPTVQTVLNDFPQVYEVGISGGRPRLFSVIPMEDISINANGDVLYHDYKGYEDAFRKHHQSAITRDIWLCKSGSAKPSPLTSQYSKLTTFRGEDRTPVWSSDGKSFYWLSERDGTFNVWKRNIDGSQEQQLTHHSGNPVRFLTAANDGTLCYGYDGELYIWRNEQEQKVSVSITADRSDRDLVREIKTSGATSIALSPNGKEVAFVMHGDIYVTSIDYKTTRQITDTPEQERNLSFAPDGRSLAYSSERNGVWQIYQTTIQNKDEKLFTYASGLTEERLTQTDRVSQQPDYSPDGKLLAFFENRADLRVMNLATKEVRTVLDGKYNYSYSSGNPLRGC